jgi:hypothetical protein
MGSGARSEREKAARRGDGSGAAEAATVLLLPRLWPFDLDVSDPGICESGAASALVGEPRSASLWAASSDSDRTGAALRSGRELDSLATGGS